MTTIYDISDIMSAWQGVTWPESTRHENKPNSEIKPPIAVQRSRYWPQKNTNLPTIKLSQTNKEEKLQIYQQ